MLRNRARNEAAGMVRGYLICVISGEFIHSNSFTQDFDGVYNVLTT